MNRDSTEHTPLRQLGHDERSVAVPLKGTEVVSGMAVVVWSPENVMVSDSVITADGVTGSVAEKVSVIIDSVSVWVGLVEGVDVRSSVALNVSVN